jgi:hypothetical protein
MIHPSAHETMMQLYREFGMRFIRIRPDRHGNSCWYCEALRDRVIPLDVFDRDRPMDGTKCARTDECTCAVEPLPVYPDDARPMHDA